MQIPPFNACFRPVGEQTSYGRYGKGKTPATIQYMAGLFCNWQRVVS
jgi:hypothetical protein